MKRLAAILRDFSVTLWVGGLWTIGYLVAPILFHVLDDRALAGTLAGHLFRAIGWTGMVCGAYLLLHGLLNYRAGVAKRGAFWFVLAMLAVTLVLQFWLQPFVASLRSAGAPVDALAAPGRHFALWHGVSSALYLLESLLGLGLVATSRG